MTGTASDSRARPIDRRTFLGLLFGAAGLAAGVSCDAGRPDPAAIRARARTYDPGLDCTDASGLFPAEIKTRTGNNYTDRSTRDLEYCFTCANFVPPRRPGACASCTTVKGPIQPLGWCDAWARGRLQG